VRSVGKEGVRLADTYQTTSNFSEMHHPVGSVLFSKSHLFATRKEPLKGSVTLLIIVLLFIIVITLLALLGLGF
jgi:hypothetical protein